MKKFASIVLALLLTFSFAAAAFAAENFVSSPSGVASVALKSFTGGSGSLVITSYSRRNALSGDKLGIIEKAYSEITSAESLDKLNGGLADAAAKKGFKASDLLVSELFDITYTPEEGGAPAGELAIELTADTLHNFVALMAFDGEKWTLVDGAKVSTDESTLTFTAGSFVSFAIVVASDAAVPVSPTTGETNMPLIIAAAAVLCAGAAAAFVVVGKKKKTEA